MLTLLGLARVSVPVLCLSFIVQPVAAQVPAGSTSVQVRTSVFEFESRRYSFDDSSMDSKEISQRWGPAPSFGVTLGYAVREFLVLQLQTGFERASRGARHDDTFTSKARRFEVTPGTRFTMRATRAAWFVGLGLGYAYETQGLSGNEDETKHSALLSLGAGVHIFVRESLSLDPIIELTRIQGTYENEYDVVESPYNPTVQTRTIDAGMSGFRFVLAVGLTGWL